MCNLSPAILLLYKFFHIQLRESDFLLQKLWFFLYQLYLFVKLYYIFPLYSLFTLFKGIQYDF